MTVTEIVGWAAAIVAAYLTVAYIAVRFAGSGRREGRRLRELGWDDPALDPDDADGPEGAG